MDLNQWECPIITNWLQAVLSCPFMSEHEIDFYAYKLPIMVLLAANTFFLLWIMVVSGYNTIY